MRISEYPAYKPSGSKWLGDIPAHWKVSRLKYVAASNFSGVNKHTVDDETPVRLCNYVDVYYNDYITPDIAFMEATATQTEIARFTLKKGDVLVTKDSEAWDDIAIPAYVVSDLQGILCGYHLAHIRAAIGVFHGEYLFRAFSASGINDQFMVEATGITRYGLGKYGLDNSLFPLPPIEEQHAIAAFLNHETKRIDQLIIRKERQIELLQEKRSALISHAVTKGLNPKAKMRDSGIEWLGEIPEHWEITKLKFVCLVKGRIGFRGYTTDDLVNQGEGALTLGATQIDDYGNIDLSAPVYIAWDKYYESPEIMIQPEDVLIVQRGSTCGKIGIIPGTFEKSTINPSLVILKNHKIKNRFVFYHLFASHLRERVNALISSTAIPMLSQEQISNLPVVHPDTVEQDRIVRYIDEQTDRIERMMQKVKSSIDRLEEYRTALISAAVTGKIDVRKEAA